MRKKYLFFIIISLVIGFASVSTIIYINGKTNIGANMEDYSIYFSEAYIDDEERLDVISEDKQKITISTKVLKDIGDFEKLEYDVTNASKQYDAKVSITCEPTENEYYEMEHVFENEIIKARTYETGYIIIKLKKVSVEEQDIEFTCTLKVEALEKTELNTSNIKTRCEFDEGQEWNFEYTGTEQTFEVPCNGTYKLEVWGAQGGNYNTQYIGGYGGYATGEIFLLKSEKNYVIVGGAGIGGSHGAKIGGYNGGGSASSSQTSGTYDASGGGATHIAKISGLLSTLENQKNQILIVAGGGGGAAGNSGVMFVNGGSGGGINGGCGGRFTESRIGHDEYGLGGTQTEGGKYYLTLSQGGEGGFGIGGSSGHNGAGGGLYGGGVGVYSAGGGSGYVGHPQLKSKAMYCYQCETSDAEETKTYSVINTSVDPISQYAKQGNGYAKITLVSLN